MSGDVGWRFAYASVKGRSHFESGVPCEDSSLCALLEAGEASVLVAAVSDGAGSASHSEIGSQLASSAFAQEMAAFVRERGVDVPLTREDVETWLSDLRDRVLREAEQLGLVSRDLACTFVGAVVTPTWAAYCQVGDGAIVINALSEDHPDGTNPEFEIVFWPEQGEYANETYFATMEGAAQHLQFRVDPRPARDLALFSDGIQRLVLMFDSRRPFDPFFRRMFRPLHELEGASGEARELSRGLGAYLSSPTVSERTDDDLTLLLATRHYELTGGPDEKSPLDESKSAKLPVISAQTVEADPAIAVDAGRPSVPET